jgi:Protein of unknown function (DUF3892)
LPIGEADRRGVAPPDNTTDVRPVRRVTCVTRRDDHLPPHRRISHLGGGDWQLEEDEAIAMVKLNMNAFFLETDGGTEYLVLRSHQGREYLTTEGDGLVPHSLISLPGCRR